MAQQGEGKPRSSYAASPTSSPSGDFNYDDPDAHMDGARKIEVFQPERPNILQRAMAFFRGSKNTDDGAQQIKLQQQQLREMRLEKLPAAADSESRFTELASPADQPAPAFQPVTPRATQMQSGYGNSEMAEMRRKIEQVETALGSRNAALSRDEENRIKK